MFNNFSLYQFKNLKYKNKLFEVTFIIRPITAPIVPPISPAITNKIVAIKAPSPSSQISIFGKPACAYAIKNPTSAAPKALTMNPYPSPPNTSQIKSPPSS